MRGRGKRKIEKPALSLATSKARGENKKRKGEETRNAYRL